MNHKQLMEIIRNKDFSVDNVLLLEELYWSDLFKISEEELYEFVLPWIIELETIQEYSGVQKLYQNPDGAHLDFFQEAIAMLYRTNPILYIKAAMEFPDYGLDTLYIFRNRNVFMDYISERNLLLKLVDDEKSKDQISKFFKYYEGLCKT